MLNVYLQTGPAHEAACGLAVVDVLERGKHSITISLPDKECRPDMITRAADIAGPIENAVWEADADYNCNAFLCRGYQFEDNTDNVQVVKGGDVLYFHVNLIAGHHPGYAVSAPFPCPLHFPKDYVLE